MKYGMILAALLLALAGYFLFLHVPASTSRMVVRVPAVEAAPAEADPKQVHAFCSTCHAYAPPETFPRAQWPEEVRRAYDFYRESGHRADPPDLERVIAYYQNRAPLELPAARNMPLATMPLPVKLQAAGWSPPGRPPVAGVTNVQLAHLSRPDRLDVLACHFNPGRGWCGKPFE